MFSFSYKNRIAFNYILSTGLLISVVFCAIYTITLYSINKHINDDIKEESSEYLEQIEIDSNNAYLIQVNQWRESDNNRVNVNPVFVQFFDNENKLIDKSPNLKGFQLKLHKHEKDNQFVDSYLNKKPIRQIQIPLFDKGKKIGYLFVAMSLDEATLILTNLRNTLFITFPLILVLLFFIARLIAGRSIKPVTLITETSRTITKDNLKDRIVLPQNKDELYVLSKTINDLLDRIENAVEREKQFTSDASHELRTPLTVLKGTLEVLIRKPRSKAEYEEKINFSISEVNRLNNLVDQLLLLARFENHKQSLRIEKIYLNAIILNALTLFSSKIKDKQVQVLYDFSKDYYIKSDNYLVSIIISNLISNALKYSSQEGKVVISLSKNGSKTICSITDNGIGIAQEDIDKIFNPFYRSDATNHPDIKGSGLGLSIVKKICQLLHVGIEVKSIVNQGTTIVLTFD
ncbi:HAMP domain-containing sensor histidine kinase [Flavobacterium sp. A45]|uniref:sensor histidine kinase n=1 Tax=Flavobacterium sp. A45 TaxID=1945862 RepID=UPI000985E46D|nr:ATP-binding protein [Flavobacterium sp. A45]OOG73587.1 two-component sensor histidine kinase [Flavobacterium sp. A45]